jgi:hypothetical protein
LQTTVETKIRFTLNLRNAILIQNKEEFID